MDLKTLFFFFVVLVPNRIPLAISQHVGHKVLNISCTVNDHYAILDACKFEAKSNTLTLFNVTGTVTKTLETLWGSVDIGLKPTRSLSHKYISIFKTNADYCSILSGKIRDIVIEPVFKKLKNFTNILVSCPLLPKQYYFHYPYTDGLFSFIAPTGLYRLDTKFYFKNDTVGTVLIFVKT